MKNDAIYMGICFLLCLVKWLPRSGALVLAGGLAKLGYYLASQERQRTLSNLALAFGNTMSAKQRVTVAKQVFSNIAQNLVDSIIMERLLKKNPQNIMAVTNVAVAFAALEKKEGIVFLTAHTGCFEMMPPCFSLLGFPILVTGAKIYDDRLNRLISENRRLFNVTYIQRDENLREMINGLKQGMGLGVLCDLHTRGESRTLPFFGRPAKTVSGPFKLAIKFHAAMIPVLTRRKSDGTQQVTVYPEIIPQGETLEEKIIFSMKRYHQILEEFIRADPTQWIWMHDRWKK